MHSLLYLQQKELLPEVERLFVVLFKDDEEAPIEQPFVGLHYFHFEPTDRSTELDSCHDRES